MTVRVREDNSLYSEPDYSTNTGNGRTVKVDYKSYQRGFSSWMEDVVNVDFYKRQKAGELFNNKMRKHSLMIHENYPLIVNCKGFKTYEQDISYHVPYPYPWPWPIMQAPSDELLSGSKAAITQAWANATLTETQILASLGELPETLRFFFKCLRGILQLLRDWFTGSWGRAYRRIKYDSYTFDDKADLWMELRYALRPSVYEIVQTLKALQAQITIPRFTSRGFNSSVEKTHQDTKIGYYWTALPAGKLFELPIRTSVVKSEYYRAGVLSKIESDLDEMLAFWGVDQVFESAWELTKLSFLIDWIFNIGDTVASWTSNAGITPLLSWCTQTVEKHYTSVPTGSLIRYPNCWPSNIKPCEIKDWGGVDFVEKSVIRIPDPPKPVLPVVDLNFDILKGIDTALILRGPVKALWKSFL